MLSHYALNRVQAQSGSLPYSFGREERFEDVRLDLRRNSRAVVADLNYGAGIIAIGSNSELALSAHGVNGIVNNVGPDLIELAAE